MDGFPLFFATSGPTKRRKHYFCLLFSQYWVGVEKSQCSRHFSKKSIPGLFYLEPHRKVNATTLELSATNFKNLKKNRPTRFQTLTFGRNLGFQKPGICPRQPPGGFIFPEMTPPQKKRNKNDNIGQPLKSPCFDKMASFFMLFVGPMFFWAP